MLYQEKMSTFIVRNPESPILIFPGPHLMYYLPWAGLGTQYALTRSRFRRSSDLSTNLIHTTTTTPRYNFHPSMCSEVALVNAVDVYLVTDESSTAPPALHCSQLLPATNNHLN